MKIKKMDRSHTETDVNDEEAKSFEEMLSESLEKNDARPESRKQGFKGKERPSKAEVSLKHSPGETVSGKITRLEKFGAFVEISPGIEGLLHISEVSWKRIEDLSKILKVGDTVKTKLLKIDDSDPRKLKISLSIKQLEGNPWNNLPSNFVVGAIVKGTVSRCMPFGAFVEFLPGVEGLIPLSQFTSKRRINQAEEVVSKGQEVSVMLKEINLDTRRMSLSLKDAEDADASATEAEDIKAFKEKQAKQSSDIGDSDIAKKLKAALEKKST